MGVKITAEYFEHATDREPVDDDLERVNCTKGCSQCGWNWEHNCPAFERTTTGAQPKLSRRFVFSIPTSKRTATDAQRKLSCRFGYMIPGLERIISGKIDNRDHGLCHNLQKLTDGDVYARLKECFMLLGYGDSVYPLGATLGDCWEDGRRRDLAKEVLSLCRK